LNNGELCASGNQCISGKCSRPDVCDNPKLMSLINVSSEFSCEYKCSDNVSQNSDPLFPQSRIIHSPPTSFPGPRVLG
jgi:hypothetical protein